MGSADDGSGGGGGGGAAGQPSDSAANMTGIALAVGGNLLVSVALNLTKHAHNVNRARASPLPYVKLPLWWVGFFATLVGELGNFAAYGFAEASIIAPLGAVSVLAKREAIRDVFVGRFASQNGARVPADDLVSERAETLAQGRLRSDKSPLVVAVNRGFVAGVKVRVDPALRLVHHLVVHLREDLPHRPRRRRRRRRTLGNGCALRRPRPSRVLERSGFRFPSRRHQVQPRRSRSRDARPDVLNVVVRDGGESEGVVAVLVRLVVPVVVDDGQEHAVPRPSQPGRRGERK